ncbi:MAG: hypothetical protein ACR2OU_07645 [Thermomicrobiales bacterium]
MRRRGCLVTVGIFFLLIVICVGVVWFVAVPRIRDSVTDGVANTISTQVADQFSGTPISSGTYTLSVADLNQQFAQNVQGVNDAKISVDTSQLSLSFTSNSQSFGYTGVPVAKDGQLVMQDMKVDNSTLGWFLPANKLGDAIDKGVNTYFASQGLQIDSLQLGNGEITFTTSPKP